MRRFSDRKVAGRLLAEHLAHYGGRDDVVVLALPRGGVPVAYEVAQALDAPLDVFVVRKLGVPGFEEVALGAVASGGARVLTSRSSRSLQSASMRSSGSRRASWLRWSGAGGSTAGSGRSSIC